MTMGPLFRETDRSERRTQRALTLSAIVGVLLVAALYTHAFQELVHRLGEPLALVRDVVAGSTRPVAELSRTRQELITENARLREEVALARIALALTDALTQENAELRAKLTSTVLSERSLFAPILRRPPEMLYDTLLIGAGARDGVSVGDAVRVDGLALGTVVRVGARTATVVLHTSPGEMQQGYLVQASSTYPIRLKGIGQGAFETFVPRSYEVQAGDTTYLYTDEWLVLGTIASVSENPQDSLLRAVVHLPIGLWDIRTVRVTGAVSGG
jgi:cell shape-determining protein MreC